LLKYLKTWVKENNTIVIGVFHDLNIARHFGDKAIIMDKGEIAANGNIDEILNSQILNNVYGIDIREFMKESFEKWRK